MCHDGLSIRLNFILQEVDLDTTFKETLRLPAGAITHTYRVSCEVMRHGEEYKGDHETDNMLLNLTRV